MHHSSMPTPFPPVVSSPACLTVTPVNAHHRPGLSCPPCPASATPLHPHPGPCPSTSVCLIPATSCQLHPHVICPSLPCHPASMPHLNEPTHAPVCMHTSQLRLAVPPLSHCG